MYTYVIYICYIYIYVIYICYIYMLYIYIYVGDLINTSLTSHYSPVTSRFYPQFCPKDSMVPTPSSGWWLSLLIYGYYMVNDNIDNNDNNILVGGFSPTPLKHDGVKVSWDDDIPFPIDGQSLYFHGSSHHHPVMVTWLLIIHRV